MTIRSISVAFGGNGEAPHIGSFIVMFQAATICLSAWKLHLLHLSKKEAIDKDVLEAVKKITKKKPMPEIDLSSFI
ncbi:MAG: hypothetical protein ACPLY9_06330 [Nitrososphaerales archaeon]